MIIEVRDISWHCYLVKCKMGYCFTNHRTRRTVGIYRAGERIAGSANSILLAGSKFAWIALTYCFEGRKRHKHFVQPYRSVRRVNLSISERTSTSSSNGTAVAKCNGFSFSFVAPFSKDPYLALDTRVFSLAGPFIEFIVDFCYITSSLFCIIFR